jgi:hypothetical protein
MKDPTREINLAKFQAELQKNMKRLNEEKISRAVENHERKKSQEAKPASRD